MQNTYMDGETVDHRIHTIRPQEATKHYIRKFHTENSSVIDLIFEQQRKYIFFNIINNKQTINVASLKL